MKVNQEKEKIHVIFHKLLSYSQTQIYIINSKKTVAYATLYTKLQG